MKVYEVKLCLLVGCVFFVLLGRPLLVVAQQHKKLTEYSRVKDAYAEKKEALTTELAALGVTFGKCRLLLVSLKEERELQVWVAAPKDTSYQRLKSYTFCDFSGDLGPKRQLGDGQIPEGVYRISYLNPMSNFHLSMKVDYPNTSDKVRGVKGRLGDNIFIHGSCVTIGCIPITDDKIKELFVLVAEATKLEKVQVLMLPAALTADKLKVLSARYNEADALRLWRELRPIYSFFTTYKRLPKIRIDSKGVYNCLEKG